MTRALLLVAVAAGTVRADAVVGPPGRAANVVGEIAVVIWDSAGGVEHLTRSVAMVGDAPHVGLLTATPTPPTVAVADPSFYQAVEAATAPPTVVRTRWRVGKHADSHTPPPPRWEAPYGAVRYGGQQPLDELRPAVGPALDDWLTANGYVDRPAVARWRAGFGNAGWTVTALRVPWEDHGSPPEPGEPWLGGYGAVRLSFRTPEGRPLVPTTEPSDQPLGKPFYGLRRVYVLADARMASRLKPVWAGRVDRAIVEATANACGLPPETVTALAAGSWHLTEFEESLGYGPTPPDLVFAPSTDQSAVGRPAVVVQAEVVWPYEAAGLLAAGLLALGLLAAWWAGRRWVRRLPAAPLD